MTFIEGNNLSIYRLVQEGAECSKQFIDVQEAI